MKKQPKREYRVNLIGETDLSKLSKEELNMLISYFTDGLKKYMGISDEKPDADGK